MERMNVKAQITFHWENNNSSFQINHQIVTFEMLEISEEVACIFLGNELLTVATGGPINDQ